nr:acyl-CoA-binding protein-like [Vanessa tameamea]
MRDPRQNNSFSWLLSIRSYPPISPHSKMSLDEQFQKVAASVRNWKTRPSDNENLALYSLYKQATSGDVNIAEPSEMIAKAKFKAWTGRKGISQDDAKKQYVEMAEKLQSKYA